MNHLPDDWEKYLEDCSEDDYEDVWSIVRSGSPSRSNVTVRESFIHNF
jgi:hypothetical protein